MNVTETEYAIVGDAAHGFRIYEDGSEIFGPFPTYAGAAALLKQMHDDSKAAEEPAPDFDHPAIWTAAIDGYTEAEPEELV